MGQLPLRVWQPSWASPFPLRTCLLAPAPSDPCSRYPGLVAVSEPHDHCATRDKATEPGLPLSGASVPAGSPPAGLFTRTFLPIGPFGASGCVIGLIGADTRHSRRASHRSGSGTTPAAELGCPPCSASWERVGLLGYDRPSAADVAALSNWPCLFERSRECRAPSVPLLLVVPHARSE